MINKRKSYSTEFCLKLDLNTALLISEFADIVKKPRSQIIRMILSDFFNRNLDLIDQYTNTHITIDKEEFLISILRNGFDIKPSTIEKYKKLQENEKEENSVSIR